MNPFLSVWLRPRETIREIVATNPRLHVVWLAIAMGIINALDRASDKNLGDNYSTPTILLIVLVFGPIGGILSLWIWAWLTRIAGKWLGGHADTVSLRAAGAWSAIPQIATVILWVPMAFILGEDLFRENSDRLEEHFFLLIALFGIVAVGLVSLIWSVVLVCKMVAEVQGFRSAWKGLLNIILGAVLVLLPLLAVVFSVVWLSSYR